MRKEAFISDRDVPRLLKRERTWFNIYQDSDGNSFPGCGFTLLIAAERARQGVEEDGHYRCIYRVCVRPKDSA